jgi:RNA polymerase sigma factor (sigma-70 family)
MVFDFSSNDGGGLREPHAFATTRWSLVLAAGGVNGDQAADALEKLCRAYWHPLYVYVRRRGYAPEDAQDLTQEFFHRLLARGDIAVANPEKGRFRSYLLGALKHFLSDERDKAGAAKRGGGAVIFSLDTEDVEARFAHDLASIEPPDREFDRRWATAILDQAMARLQTEFSGAGKAVVFQVLKPYLSATPEAGDYETIAQRLEMSSGAVAVTVYRLRQRYGELVRGEIAETVASPGEVEEELRELFAALGGS